MTYEGWANYQTWNVALWISNEESIYRIARAYSLRRFSNYEEFVTKILPSEHGDVTPDRVSWTDPTLDYDALDEFIRDLRS